MEKLSNNFIFKIRKNTFAWFLNLDIISLKLQNKNDIIKIFSEEIEVLKPLISVFFGISMEVIFTLISGFIISFIFDWKIACLSIIFFTILFFISYKLFLYQINLPAEKITNDYFSDSITSIKLIKSYNIKEKLFDFLIVNENKNQTMQSYFNELLNYIVIGINIFIIFTTFGLTMYLGGVFILTYQISTLERFVGSFYFSFLELNFLNLILKYIVEFSSMRNIFKKLNYIINTKYSKKSTAKKHYINKNNNALPISNFTDDSFDTKKIIEGKIEFRNVSFTYSEKNKRKVLDNISFTITPGTKVGFVGCSGSGKSTIIQLLVRFYEPDEGEIFLDDINIKHFDPIILRDYISGVFQEPDLFECSVTENIKYGNLSASRKEIENVAEIACVPSYLLYEDNIQGIFQISGGEKQRIAIARCLLKDRKIVFFDEATSALDLKTDNQINHNLNQYFNTKEKKTILIVAHR